jgi:hypothetical protein
MESRQRGVKMAVVVAIVEATAEVKLWRHGTTCAVAAILW